MMGEHQQRLFYSFNLDEHVPRDHLLRGINQFLDLSDLRSYLSFRSTATPDAPRSIRSG